MTPPGPGASVADYVAALTRLRRWAGEPPLSRLRTLGGQTVAADGTKIDALPKSTTSHVLKQTGKLPRWDFVRAFVTACLRSCDYPENLIQAEVERWRTAREALSAPRPAPATPGPAPEPSRDRDPDSAWGGHRGTGPGRGEDRGAGSGRGEDRSAGSGRGEDRSAGRVTERGPGPGAGPESDRRGEPGWNREPGLGQGPGQGSGADQWGEPVQGGEAGPGQRPGRGSEPDRGRGPGWDREPGLGRGAGRSSETGAGSEPVRDLGSHASRGLPVGEQGPESVRDRRSMDELGSDQRSAAGRVPVQGRTPDADRDSVPDSRTDREPDAGRESDVGREPVRDRGRDTFPGPEAEPGSAVGRAPDLDAGVSTVPDAGVNAVPDAGVDAGRAAAPYGRTADPVIELLARRVAREEDRARWGLLGGFSVAPVAFGPGDGGAPVGDLNSIAEYVAGLRPQRLLVVGESGAGKTVLAIELVLRLVEPLVAAGGRYAGRPVVPVRLNAAGWSAGMPFGDWLAAELVRNYGLAAADAARLVHDRRILPVLDGLDELDPESAIGAPRRAIGLLTELNRYSDLSGRRPGPVVVTCRAGRYAELTAARTGLASAAHAELRRLTTAQISAYLRDRWPDGHPCARQREAVLSALTGPAADPVQNAVATPWRLTLLATAVESGADPADLLDPYGDQDTPPDAADRIARRLLDAYVPAATHLTPRGAHRVPYRPEQVRTWLEHLAGHLRGQAGYAGRAAPGLTSADLVPHLLWPIGGAWLVRGLHGVGCLLLAVLAMLAFGVGSAVDTPAGLRDGLGVGEALTLALMAGWVAIATRLSLSAWPSAAGGRGNVPVTRRLLGGLLGLAAGAVIGVAGGLTGLVLTGGSVFGPAYAIAAGACGGAVLGTIIGLTAAGRRGGERMRVAEAVRAQPVTLVGFGLCGALTGLAPLRLAHAPAVPLVLGTAGTFILAYALGTAFTIATGGWSADAELAHPREALRRNPAIGVAFGLTGGVAAYLVFVLNRDMLTSLACAVVGGVAFGLAFGAIAWCRTMIGLLVAGMRGLLPLRLWTFLDWACEARLLRVSGATYQFRHRELQDYLARRP